MVSLHARLCLRNKNLHCFRACLRTRTPTRSAKYQVNSLRSFIRSSLEYITLDIQKKRCSSVAFENIHSISQLSSRCHRFLSHMVFATVESLVFLWNLPLCNMPAVHSDERSLRTLPKKKPSMRNGMMGTSWMKAVVSSATHQGRRKYSSKCEIFHGEVKVEGKKNTHPLSF